MFRILPWFLCLALAGATGGSCKDRPAFTPQSVQKFLAGQSYRLTTTEPRDDWIREIKGVQTSACFEVQQGPTLMSLCLFWFSTREQAGQAGKVVENLGWKKGRMHACLVYGQALAVVDARLPDKVVANNLLETLARFE